MGIKHLQDITDIIKQAEVPLTKADIDAKYELKTKKRLAYTTCKESIAHLLKEKKIKTVKMRIWKRDRIGYKLVD